MLIADRVSKHYDTPRGPVAVVEDVSLKLEAGEAAAIMGPSGSGKSTLLYLFGALEPPSSGTVTVAGANPYALSERDQAAFRNRHIGFVFQEHMLLPQLSALDNVIVPTLVVPNSPGIGRHDASSLARALLEQVGLGDRLQHLPGELSGGERQRVAIARALINGPTVVLCDEPTGNLDRASAEAVADLLVSVHEQHHTTLIVVTHSPALAARFRRRYELNDRRLSPAKTGIEEKF